MVHTATCIIGIRGVGNKISIGQATETTPMATPISGLREKCLTMPIFQGKHWRGHGLTRLSDSYASGSISEQLLLANCRI